MKSCEKLHTILWCDDEIVLSLFILVGEMLFIVAKRHLVLSSITQSYGTPSTFMEYCSVLWSSALFYGMCVYFHQGLSSFRLILFSRPFASRTVYHLEKSNSIIFFSILFYFHNCHNEEIMRFMEELNSAIFWMLPLSDWTLQSGAFLEYDEHRPTQSSTTKKKRPFANNFEFVAFSSDDTEWWPN